MITPQAQAQMDALAAARTPRAVEPARLTLADLRPGMVVREARDGTGRALDHDCPTRVGFIVDWAVDDCGETRVVVVKEQPAGPGGRHTLKRWLLALGCLDADPMYVQPGDPNFPSTCQQRAMYLLRCLLDTGGEWHHRQDQLVQWCLRLVHQEGI